MPTFFLRACAAAFLLMASGCSRAETPKLTPVAYSLYLAADANAAQLLQTLTTTYTRLNPNVNFRVSVDTPASIGQRLGGGEISLGVVSLLPQTTLPSPWIGELAQDAVLPIVNAANPATTIGAPQLRDVFAGSRNQWDEFGAPGLGEIQVALRDVGESSRASFDSSIMGNVRLTSSAIVLPTNEVMINFVSLTPNAIGYVTLSHLKNKPESKVKILAIDGAQAGPASIADGSYKIPQTIYFLAAIEPQGELRRFVAWCLGEQGQKIVEAANYVSITRAK
ncbi:MAG: substrate-binding domain-containing protein [Anaerolineae bacterium]